MGRYVKGQETNYIISRKVLLAVLKDAEAYTSAFLEEWGDQMRPGKTEGMEHYETAKKSLGRVRWWLKKVNKS